MSVWLVCYISFKGTVNPLVPSIKAVKDVPLMQVFVSYTINVSLRFFWECTTFDASWYNETYFIEKICRSHHRGSVFDMIYDTMEWKQELFLKLNNSRKCVTRKYYNNALIESYYQVNRFWSEKYLQINCLSLPISLLFMALVHLSCKVIPNDSFKCRKKKNM